MNIKSSNWTSFGVADLTIRVRLTKPQFPFRRRIFVSCGYIFQAKLRELLGHESPPYEVTPSVVGYMSLAVLPDVQEPPSMRIPHTLTPTLPPGPVNCLVYSISCPRAVTVVGGFPNSPNGLPKRHKIFFY